MCRCARLFAGLLIVSCVTIGCGKGSIKPELVTMYNKQKNSFVGIDEIKKSIQQGFREFDKDETSSIDKLDQARPLKRILVYESDAEKWPEECRKRIESKKPFPFQGRERHLGVLDILSAADKGELTENHLVLGEYDSRRGIDDGSDEKGIREISGLLPGVRYAAFAKTIVKKCPELMPNPDYDSEAVVKNLNIPLSAKYLFDPGLAVLVIAIWDINEKKFIFRRSVELSAGYAVSAEGLTGADAFRKMERELLMSVKESAKTKRDEIWNELIPEWGYDGDLLAGTNGGGMFFLVEKK